jgi:hypothetical protein
MEIELPILRFIGSIDHEGDTKYCTVSIPGWMNKQVHEYLLKKAERWEEFYACLIGYVSTEIIEGDWIVNQIEHHHATHTITYKLELKKLVRHYTL